MGRRIRPRALLALLAGVLAGTATAGPVDSASAAYAVRAAERVPDPEIDVRGRLAAELRAFPEPGALGQDRLQPSASGRVELYTDWNDGRDSLTVTPFLRVDGTDPRRTHADLREAYFTHLGDGWELHAGARRVFWGRAESVHLVDVINQTDLVEDIDGEDRLGQPMVQLVFLGDRGALELFLLPGARQRTYPSTEGRLAGPVRIDGDARFTAGAGALQTSWAVRWSGFAGPLDFGLSHFDGTAREPDFELRAAPVPGEPLRLRPVYETVTRTSLDAQLITGDTAFKLELLHRRGRGPRSTAFVAGVEHTLVGALGTRTDVGLLAEVLFDDRPVDTALTTFESDLFLGTRLALNDAAASRALAGVLLDPQTGEALWVVEASRRLGAHWRLSLDVRSYAGSRPPALGDPAALVDRDARLGALADDDHVQLELARFF